MHRSDRRSLFSLVAAATLLAATFSHAAINTSSAADAATSAQAAVALEAGRALLRRNRADEALPQLESALATYARAGDAAGAAAARDQIGDIYLRQGQYSVALQNYQPAYEAFRAKGDCPNGALLLVKIGETHYLAGDAEAARAAFARVGECGAKGAAAGGGNDSRGGAAFLPAGAAAGFAACSAPPRPDNQAQNGNGANGTPAKEPTLGHGPTARSRTVRMDLRVVDQGGNPVKGVKAKLWSERQENGFLCDCTHYTDAAGKVLMDPIHFSKTLNLELAAKGFEPLTLSVDPKALDQPFRAVMQAKGAAQAAQTAARASDAAGAAGAAAPSCSDLFRLFVAYGFAELGAARADFEAGRLDSARAHYANVLAASGDDAPAGKFLAARLLRAVARTSLGDVAFKQGRFDDAAALYSEAAAGARRDNRLELAWAAQRGLARTLWAQSAQSPAAPAAAAKREEALQTYRAALTTVETLFGGGLRADEARTNFLSTTRDLFEDAAAAFAESALAAQQVPAARPAARRVGEGAHAYQPPQPLEGRALAYAAEAFRVVEQGRARSLLDLIGESRAEITEGLPAELVARRAANAARQQEIADKLRGVRAASDAAPAQSVAQLEAELERLSVERDAIENQMRTASPRYRAHVRSQPLALAEVQRQVLDEGTALVEYSLGRDRSYLFAVTRAGLVLHKLPPRAEIEAQAVGLRRHLIPAGTRRAIAGVDVRGIGEELQSQTAGRGLGLGNTAAAPQAVAAYAAAAHALYRTLLAPAAAFVGARRLLVVADGALNYVPFEALVTAPGGVDYAGLNYLVKTHEVVYAPSASIVAAVRAQPRPAAAGGGMLVVADPVFDASDSRARGRGVKTKEAGAQRAALQSALADVTSLNLAGLKLVRLAGTRDEAEQIATLARAQGGAADVWLDFDASEANLSRRALSSYRVLHFATHGLLDAERPRFTGLALSLVGDADADGFLRVEEVFNLKLGSPLVVLSACETGLGRERRGEGVIGLTRAFMYAGAPAVGVSLWSVGDRSTAELMPDFYRRLLASQGRAPAAAMRAAQRQMIDGKRYSAPFYWAPFVLVGDWR